MGLSSAGTFRTENGYIKIGLKSKQHGDNMDTLGVKKYATKVEWKRSYVTIGSKLFIGHAHCEK